MSDFEVECYAGYRADESPRVLIIRGRRYEITEILHQWQEPGRRYFKLRVRNGEEYLVYHDAATDSWLEAGHRAAARG
jgi:hypothetical protein